MSTHAEEVQIITGGPEPAPAAADTGSEPAAAIAADTEHSDCPYCGDTSRHEKRRYRFCGHEAAAGAGA